MQSRKTCPRCGSELPADAPAGNCPACLVDLALSAEAADFSGEEPDPNAKRIGQSVIHRQLGEGGIGVVWLARDLSLNRWEAIKILKPAFQKQGELVERLRQEAQFLAQLNHPNIITVYRVGEDAGEFFIAMEYLPRGSLQDELDQRGRLDWRDATLIIRDAVCGLAAAHAAGVVHRDIKPGNLLRAEAGLTKVGDFGMARLKAGTSIVTQAGQLIGTPSFIAPEQIPLSSARETASPRGTVDARADLYSLICTYYALLTGHPPFDPPGESPPRDLVLYRHLHEPFPDAGKEVPDLPAGVAAILDRGSQRDPAARYQTASELTRDLEAVLSGAELPEAERQVRGPDGREETAPRPESGAGVATGNLKRAWRKPLVALATGLLIVVLTIWGWLSRKPVVDKVTRPARAEMSETTFVEPTIQWVQPGEKELAEAKAARDKKLEGLASLSWEMIAGKFFPDEMGELQTWVESNFELPERFILVGTLAAVRVVEGKTWVGLTFGGKTFTVLVVFDQATVAEEMVDYRVGDAVRVVVARTNWNNSPPAAGRLETGLQQAAGVEGLAVVTKALSLHTPCFYQFADGGSCLCFKGEALEKSGELLSWIDARRGRVLKPVNSTELLASPGMMFRELPKWLGKTGIIQANFLRAQAAPEGLMVSLVATNSLEGPLYLQLDLGKEARAEEFQDYAPGDSVVAEVFLRGGRVNEAEVWDPEWARPILQPASLRKQMTRWQGQPVLTNACSNPLTAWNGILASCSRLQKAGQSTTLVTARGSRRKPGPPGEPSGPTTNATPPAPPGKEILVTGTLTMLFGMEGEAHCVVSTEQPQAGALTYEACTRQPAFMKATSDYFSSRERRRNGDIVKIRGILWPAEAPRFRLVREAILLSLKEIERVGDPASRVVVGQPRSLETIETNRAPSSLMQLLRDIPPPGTEVKFSGFFYDVCYDGRVTIGPGEGLAYGSVVASRPVVPIRFPGVSNSVWSDYEDSEARVEVVAVVRQPMLPVPELLGKRNSRDMRVVFGKTGAVPELEGKSIARWKNPRSLVTAQGRPVPPKDIAGEKTRWGRLRMYDRPMPPEKVQIEARFRGFRKKPGSSTVSFDHVFREFNSLELACTNLPPAAERFLYELDEGEEVVLEVQFEVVLSRARTLVAKTELVWLARASDPDNKVFFTSSGNLGRALFPAASRPQFIRQEKAFFPLVLSRTISYKCWCMAGLQGALIDNDSSDCAGPGEPGLPNVCRRLLQAAEIRPTACCRLGQPPSSGSTRCNLPPPTFLAALSHLLPKTGMHRDRTAIWTKR